MTEIDKHEEVLEEGLPGKKDINDSNGEIGDSINQEENFWENQSQNSCLQLGYNKAIDDCTLAYVKLQACFEYLIRKQKIVADEAARLLDENTKLKAELERVAGMTDDKIWEIFAKVFGCKPEKEDCVFNKCSHWAKCKLLVQAIKESQ